MTPTPTPTPTPPAGFRTVTKAEFFAALAADRRDTMPTTEARLFTPWRVVHTREVWGWSAPGWAGPCGTPKVFAIKAR